MDRAHARTIEGSYRLCRLGRFGFPVEELANAEGPVAALGRDGSLRMFFGSGRRVVTADGAEWRIKSMTSGRHIVPFIKSPEGTIAISGPLPAKRSYGINGEDYGLNLIPMGKTGFLSPGRWALRRYEDPIAVIDEKARIVDANEPIPVSAVIMAFTLIAHGIPGEADLMPRRD